MHDPIQDIFTILRADRVADVQIFPEGHAGMACKVQMADVRAEIGQVFADPWRARLSYPAQQFSGSLMGNRHVASQGQRRAMQNDRDFGLEIEGLGCAL